MTEITFPSLSMTSFINVLCNSFTYSFESQHISLLNLRHGPLVDSVADSLVYENSTRNIISDLRVVYSQSKSQIHLQPSIVKTRVKNDGMTEMLLSHSVATIATANVSAVDPLVITDIIYCSVSNDGINRPDISLVSKEFNSSTSSESKILSSNMSEVVSLSSFSSALKACNDIPKGMNSLIGVPSSSFSQISMGIGLCSANQMSSVKRIVDPVCQSDSHSLISAKNQDELNKGNAVTDDVVMITALPTTTSINGRIGIEEDFGEIISASIEIGPDTSNIFKNQTKGSNAAFEHSLPTSLDRTESVKRLTMLHHDEDLLSFDSIETGRCPMISDVTSVSFTMESGDVTALNKSGISTSSGKKPHTSQLSSMEQDIPSVTKNKRSKSKVQGKAESDSSEEKKESSNNFHELPVINKRKRLKKSKNSVEKNCIDDIFRNYL